MRSFAANIPELQTHILGEFLLNVQVPVLRIRRGKMPWCHKNITESSRARTRRRREYRSGYAAIERARVEIQWKDRFWANGIRDQPGRCGEVRNQQILRDIIKVKPITTAHHEFRQRAPGKAQPWSKVVRVTL